MVSKHDITAAVQAALNENQNLFLVDVKVSADNVVDVEIEAKDGSVTIDDCVAVNNRVLADVDRDIEDYELTVGSAGLTLPFKVKEQYVKFVGEQVEVLTKGGRKLCGTLTKVEEETFSIACEVKVKKEGAKRPVIETQEETFNFNDIKYTKYLINFK